VPLLPASLTEPLWVQFSTLLKDDDRPEFVADHPWGCHRRRIPNRVVFDHVLAALVHGSGYERIATPGCSDRTIRRRLAEWAERNVGVELLKAALAAYDQMIGLDLDDLSLDGSITKSPCGGELSGRSPVDRGKQGTKRSVVTDGTGIPLALVAAGANRHDSPLFEPTMRQIPDMIGPLPDQPCVHLDRGYDSAGKRWVVERTHSWMNGYGKIRRCTEKRRVVAELYLYLAAALTVLRRLINEARTRYRWPTRPTTRRLK